LRQLSPNLINLSHWLWLWNFCSNKILSSWHLSILIILLFLFIQEILCFFLFLELSFLPILNNYPSDFGWWQVLMKVLNLFEVVFVKLDILLMISLFLSYLSFILILCLSRFRLWLVLIILVIWNRKFKLRWKNILFFLRLLF